MSKTVFYYLTINNSFVKLGDLDDVLCRLSGVKASEKEYMIPEGNVVNWKDAITGILLNMPSTKCCNNTIDINDVIEALCHYCSEYDICNIESYIKCFHLLKVIGAKIIAHYDNLSIFANQERDYYIHLYDKDVWMSKEQLLHYVGELELSEEIRKDPKEIVQDIYYLLNY